MADRYLQLHKEDKDFNIGNIAFSTNGITIKTSGTIKEKPVFIEWEKIGTKDYYTYFAIYSADNPRDVNRGYNYKEDWNTAVLYSVLKTILKNKNVLTNE